MSARLALRTAVRSRDARVTGGLRLGCVPYLNARPLCHGLGELVLLPPSPLAAALRAGQLDAALVPVMEVLEQPGYRLVRGVGIGCRGAVRSVIVWPACSLNAMRTVAEDADSRTSNALARLVLPSSVEWRAAGEPADGRVVIGDPALELQRTTPGHAVLDLGDEWMRTRGLPFVFAVWAIRPGVPEAGALARTLRAAATGGLARVRDYCRSDADEDYLTRRIVHELDATAESGLLRFREELLGRGRVSVRSNLDWV